MSHIFPVDGHEYGVLQRIKGTSTHHSVLDDIFVSNAPLELFGDDRLGD